MSDRLITVATFHEPVAAALAKNYLEGQGIPAVLADEDTVATNWTLAGAIGGIKLQVAPIHVERAEMLLEQVRDDRNAVEDDLPAPTTAIATHDVAEELQSDREDKAPANKLADKLFRCAVFGLIFWPLQGYALWLMVSLATGAGKVSPKRRWKIWASVLLNGPIMILVTTPIFLGLGYFTGEPGTPDNPVWRRHQFEEHALSVSFPHEPFVDFGLTKNRYGDAHYSMRTAFAKNRTYRLRLVRCSDRLAGTPVDQALKDQVLDILADGKNKLVKESPTQLKALIGTEFVLDSGKTLERSRLYVRGRDLIEASVQGNAVDIFSDEAEAFFRSLRIRN